MTTDHQYATPSTLASAALLYASVGWRVFPLTPGAKTPIHKGGVNDATVDPKIIKGWWASHPKANIGIALAASGLMMVDLDVKPDKGIDGRKTMLDLIAVSGHPGPHALQVTPSGGRHLVFRRDAALLDKVAWEEGVDIMTKSHRYFVASPSVVNGRRYEWLTMLAPWDEVGALAPGWRTMLLAAEGAGCGAAVRPAAAGGGMDMLDIAALRVGGVSIDELHAILATLDPSMVRDPWLRVIWGAAAQWGGTKDEQAVIDAIEEWSAKTGKAGQYKPGEVAKRWHEHTVTAGGASGAGHVTWRTVRSMAREQGWTPVAIRGVNPKAWKDALATKIVDDRKVVKPTPWNAALFLAYHEDFRGGLRRNLLTNTIEMHRPEVAPLKDKAKLPLAFDRSSDWIGVANAIATKIPAFDGSEDTIAAVRAAADIHAYDPMAQYMAGLVWDGTPRVDQWLQQVCGVPDTPLMRAIGRAWLVGLAARATSEADGRGVKMDSVLVLQGGEGIGKSSVGAILGGEWFAEFSASLDGDEAYYVIERSMVLEFGELDALSRSDATRVKSLVTSQADVFRRKYAENAAVRPRRCVFIGTTNENEFLSKDMTMRRWWVVPCGSTNFNLRWLRTWREQLLAEAKVAWDSGELPILPEAVRAAHKAMVAQVQMAHPFEEAMQAWSQALPEGTEVTTGRAVEDVLGRTANSVSPTDYKRFNSLMPMFGWSRVTIQGVRMWRKG